MSAISLNCVNRVMLVGKVVGEVRFPKTGSGREQCRLTLETEKRVLVKGRPKSHFVRHALVITHQGSVEAFKSALKDGDYVQVLGEVAVEDGKTIILVTDYGHEANYMYVPGAGNKSPAPAKGGSVDTSEMTAAKGGDDGYFDEGNVMRDRQASSLPEGFDEADDIPF